MDSNFSEIQEDTADSIFKYLAMVKNAYQKTQPDINSHKCPNQIIPSH